MLAFPFVQPFSHRLLRLAVFTLALTAGAATARAANAKVTLHLQADTEQLARGGETGLDIIAEIERGWHINGHKPTEPFLIPTEVKFTLPPGISTDTVNYPRADQKAFAFAQGKELLVYEGKVIMTTAITVPADFAGTRVRLEAALRYQACNDSTCLPPATATAELTLPVSAAAASGAAGTRVEPEATGGVDVNRWMARHGLVVTLLLVALLGLGLNLTPCVYPLISVTVAYFGTQGRRRTTRVAALAAIYVGGIALSFAAVGVAAALSGGLFGAALQKPPVLIGIAALLVALALSSFGLYQLQPPAWALRRVSGAAPGALGSLFMGLTMGIVAAPCVGPAVLGLLVFVGAQQSVVLGLELFLALGLGMGLPYLALAMLAGSIKALPRSGEWLVWVEHFFGVMLLGLAAYFIAPLLPQSLSRWLLPALIAAGGIYLGFIDRAGGGWRHFRLLQRAVGMAAIATAVWAATPPSAESAISWQPFDDNSLVAARSAGRPAVVDFLADWCIPCREMEHSTYVDPKVRSAAAGFSMFKADITQENDDTGALIDRFEVRGVPTVIFFDAAGNEVQRLVGYVGPDEMLKAMRTARMQVSRAG